MIQHAVEEKIETGNNYSFRELVDANYLFVLNTCNKFVNNEQDAEDITQEVFIQVHKSLSSFKGESKISTWIYRIAVTKSLDFLRSRKRKKRFAKIHSLWTGENDDEPVLIKSEENIADDIEREDRINILITAMNSLAENQRVAFTLSKIDELSYKEIAEIMETSVSSVESLIHRAKTNLKKNLYKYYKNEL